MKTKDILDNSIIFLNTKLNQLDNTIPFMSFIRPILTRGINNNLDKFEKVLKFVEDKDGNIDIEGILGDIIGNLTIAAKKEYPDFLNGIVIGEGKIEIGIPLINKTIILNEKDINDFKNYLIAKDK